MIDMRSRVVNSGPTPRTTPVLDHVQRERVRQHEKWGPQHHKDDTDHRFSEEADAWKRFNDDMVQSTGDTTWTGILAEEFYEALAETDEVKLRAELVQVAAVAVAWIEDIDSRKDSRE